MQQEWRKRARQRARDQMDLFTFLRFIDSQQRGLRSTTRSLARLPTSPRRRHAQRITATSQQELTEEIEPLKQKIETAIDKALAESADAPDQKTFQERRDEYVQPLLDLADAVGRDMLAAADRLDIPATVHIAVGTDIIHQHKSFRAGPAAEASYRDFRILANILLEADRGGVVANIGSAVIMPEVFLKALSVARNVKKYRRNITTANFDMINHYRPHMNVVSRPTEAGGRGFNFIGHHEIMIPLLAWGIKSYFQAQL